MAETNLQEVDRRKSIALSCRKYAEAAKELAQAHEQAADAWEKGDHSAIQVAQIMCDKALRDMSYHANMSVLYKQNWKEAITTTTSLQLAT